MGGVGDMAIEPELENLIREAGIELDELEKETVNAYETRDIIPYLCKTKHREEFLDLREDMASTSIIGLENGMMRDMVNYFLQSSGLKADERLTWGPPKFNYSHGDLYDSFDYYLIAGCPNCGTDYDFGKTHFATITKPYPALKCLECGHCAAPLHYEEESDNWVDRYSGDHLQSTSTKDFIKDDKFKRGGPQSTSKGTMGGIYLRGSRYKYDFGHNNKEWWTNYYLPASIRDRELKTTLHAITLMSSMKGQKVEEKCDFCGNLEAYFHQFQARSADEGSTIMYECTKCHNRKVYNN